MTNPCPVCESELTDAHSGYGGRDVTVFTCPMCGEFTLSNTLVSDLPSTKRRNKDANVKISHAIRLMQQSNKGAELLTNTVDEILKKPLPKPSEQADIFIRWLANSSDKPGEQIHVEPATHMTIMGAKSPEGFELVLNHLFDTGLIIGIQSKTLNSHGNAHVTLSFDGWEYYEQLVHGEGSYRKAFMAMKFGDSDLENILKDFFKPAALQAGFDLNKLDDAPVAGLIDDRLRVEIQSSDFIIADLTHDNLGAYWEAGYAEGLGKPVIYTCEKEKFDSEKTHFDTNHHLTIVWDKANPTEAADNLKATIRATLPELAKQEDV